MGLDGSADAEALAFTVALSTASPDGRFAGRGVGLYAVRRELQAIGWTIALESIPAKGTRAVVRSPIETP